MGKESKDKLEYLRAINSKLRQENENLKEPVYMIKNKFDECQYSLSTIIKNWDKHDDLDFGGWDLDGLNAERGGS